MSECQDCGATGTHFCNPKDMMIRAQARRIAELETLLRYIHDYSNDNHIVVKVEAALSGRGGDV
jgi:hypothetical protein